MDTKPTLIEVEQKEHRADELARKLEDRRSREVELSRALAEAHANGDGDTSELKRERRDVRDEIDDLAAALPILRQQIAEARGLALMDEAERRTLGIKKGHGSLRSEYAEDVERMRAAAETYIDAVRRLNERYHGLALLGLEAEALAARFGLEPADLALVQPPALVDEARAVLSRVQSARLNGRLRPTTDRERRRLVAQTPGGKLIEAAGPTEAEKAEAERLEREKREREAREQRELGPIAREIKQLEQVAESGVPLSRF